MELSERDADGITPEAQLLAEQPILLQAMLAPSQDALMQAGMEGMNPGIQEPSFLGQVMRALWRKWSGANKRAVAAEVAKGIPRDYAELNVLMGPEHPYHYENLLRSDGSQWWPLVEDLDIPMPRTIIVDAGTEMDLDPEFQAAFTGKGTTPRVAAFFSELLEAAHDVGYPVFIRTGQLSAKHAGVAAYKARNDQELINCFMLLVQATLTLQGVLLRSVMVREWLDLDGGFHAFGTPNTPGHLIAREFRCFSDGTKARVAPYWPANAMQFTGPEPDNWQGILAAQNALTTQERSFLETQACKIAAALGETAWSIDMAQGKDGEWYFVDCAPANISHDPEGIDGVRDALDDAPQEFFDEHRQLYRD